MLKRLMGNDYEISLFSIWSKRTLKIPSKWDMFYIGKSFLIASCD